jgi:hypothetical protein
MHVEAGVAVEPSSDRAGGREKRYSFIASASLSVMPVKLVYGNTGK